MKMADIRKLNNEIVKNSEEYVFLKKLYEHCLSVLDKVPESFVNEVLEEANKLQIPMEKMYFYQFYQHNTLVTCVSFCGYSEELEEEFDKKIMVDASGFKFRGVDMALYFDDENTVTFSDGNGYLSEENIKRVFGKKLLRAECEIYDVSVKCFE